MVPIQETLQLHDQTSRGPLVWTRSGRQGNQTVLLTTDAEHN